VRGSRTIEWSRCRRWWSIPACAGEPYLPAPECWGYRVYPRVCGGARQESGTGAADKGLSPRVRGSLVNVKRFWMATRSIPACAGEPSGGGLGKGKQGVYPRVCGGAQKFRVRTVTPTGLSPRVRGSHVMRIWQGGAGRSIPACAGEPTARVEYGTLERVYPRVCGGAARTGGRVRRRLGLSPRVRGSHYRYLLLGGYFGSIPACAGEPLRQRSRAWPATVYPRVCGGAKPKGSANVTTKGLSPRVRGSPRRSGQHRQRGRSIPACAGEPSPPGNAGCCHRVYPRVCGGA